MAWENLWKNNDGIRDNWVGMWEQVVTKFKGLSEVLGIELVNEPFAGDFIHNPEIIFPWGRHSADYEEM